ncbi:MAG: short-subunit dehydrogenase [Limisphaerales bacterium]|jgi:short-subunit dehydrogenase
MPTALITGGSSGIGLELSKYFIRGGYQLLWLAATDSEIENGKAIVESEFPDANILSIALDLSKPEAAQQTYDWVFTQIDQLDVLVNNAGFGTYGFTNDIDIQDELNMINVNLLSPYKLSRLFIKGMIKRDNGQIINISSSSSFQPVPKMNTYASTKAFVKHWSRGISEELKMINSNVKMLVICPAAVKNTAFRNRGFQKVKTFEGLAYTTAEEVAKDTWKAFKSGKSFYVTGWKQRIVMLFHNLVPYSITQKFVRMEVAEK